MSEPGADWHLVVAGSLRQRTGGYLYDARIVDSLRRRGRNMAVHELAGRFPHPDQAASESLDACLQSLPERSLVVLDGLAAGAQPEVVRRHADRLRLIALVHHLLADESGLTPAQSLELLRLEQDQLQLCRGCIVTSPTTRQRVQAVIGEVLPLEVVIPGIRKHPAAEPDPETAPQILNVGSLVPRKAQHVLVEALARLVELDWQCHLVGSPDRDRDYAALVRERIGATGLQSRVNLHGELEESALSARFQCASVFVLSSLHEGYGMVLTEAMARGLPVVATTGGAIPDTVPEGAGILVPPADPDALAAALRRCLLDPALRRRLSAAALAHAAALPGWEQTADHFAAALEALA